MLPERVYKFNYDHDGSVETRVALPLSMETARLSSKINVLCHDFVRRDVRRFTWDRISNVEDVTDNCLVFDNLPQKQFNFYKNSNLSVFKADNGKIYIVNAG